MSACLTTIKELKEQRAGRVKNRMFAEAEKQNEEIKTFGSERNERTWRK